MQMIFNAYGGEEGIDLGDLIRMNRECGDLLARAEYSGSEGCYVEVARWNYRSGRWERFAFRKFFGGELPEVGESFGALETAKIIAISINDSGDSVHKPLIHRLPNYEP